MRLLLTFIFLFINGFLYSQVYIGNSNYGDWEYRTRVDSVFNLPFTITDSVKSNFHRPGAVKVAKQDTTIRLSTDGYTYDQRVLTTKDTSKIAGKWQINLQQVLTGGNSSTLGATFGRPIKVDSLGNNSGAIRYDLKTNTIYDDLNVRAALFINGARRLYDNGGVLVVDFAGSNLKDASGNNNLNWSTTNLAKVTRLQTLQPSSSGAGIYKLGKVLTGSDSKPYAEVDIDGTLYYIPLLTTLP